MPVCLAGTRGPCQQAFHITRRTVAGCLQKTPNFITVISADGKLHKLEGKQLMICIWGCSSKVSDNDTVVENFFCGFKEEALTEPVGTTD